MLRILRRKLPLQQSEKAFHPRPSVRPRPTRFPHHRLPSREKAHRRCALFRAAPELIDEVHPPAGRIHATFDKAAPRQTKLCRPPPEVPPPRKPLSLQPPAQIAYCHRVFGWAFGAFPASRGE